MAHDDAALLSGLVPHIAGLGYEF